MDYKLILFLGFFILSCSNEQKPNVSNPIAEHDKVKHIDNHQIKLKQLATEELINDSLNHTDSYGMKQGKWIHKIKNRTVYKELNYIDDKKHGKQIDYYSNGDLRTIKNYKLGKLEGYQYSFYKGKSEYYLVSYYKNDTNLWAGFPLANKEFIFPIKRFHILVDSVYVKAPYSNGNTWYEGNFVSKNRKIFKLGIHKIYHLNGEIKAIIDYDKKTISQFDSNRKAIDINMSL